MTRKRCYSLPLSVGSLFRRSSATAVNKTRTRSPCLGAESDQRCLNPSPATKYSSTRMVSSATTSLQAATYQSAVELDGADLRGVDVRREWGNIDLLISCEEPRFVLAIENKIDSGEHDRQLERYKGTVVKGREFSGVRSLLVFLTPKGDIPSDKDWVSYSCADLHRAFTSPVTVLHAADATGLHPFFICVGKEEQPCRIRHASFPYDAAYSGEPLPIITVEFRQASGAPGVTLDRVIMRTGYAHRRNYHPR